MEEAGVEAHAHGELQHCGNVAATCRAGYGETEHMARVTARLGKGRGYIAGGAGALRLRANIIALAKDAREPEAESPVAGDGFHPGVLRSLHSEPRP